MEKKRPVDRSIGPIDGAPMPAPSGRVGGGQLVTADDAIAALIARTRRIAVLGIKPEWTGQPAYYVPAYAHRAGFEIVPVPVYYPDLTEMLGSRVYRRLVDIPGPIDVVNVFRRPADVPAHLDEDRLDLGHGDVALGHPYAARDVGAKVANALEVGV